MRPSPAMPEGDKEAQVPRHGADVAAKVGLQAAQGGHQVGPAVFASCWLRNLMNLVHQYPLTQLFDVINSTVLDGQPLYYTINYIFPLLWYLQPSESGCFV
jgi:hypothetical protein